MTTDTPRGRRRLFVMWRDGDDSVPVGVLVRSTSHDRVRYSFSYLRGAKSIPGFRPFPSFPALDRVYQGRRLFPLFANRLMSAKRPEYSAVLHRLGLEVGADEIDVLARSSGRNLTDRTEVFLEPQLDPVSGRYVGFFFARTSSETKRASVSGLSRGLGLAIGREAGGDRRLSLTTPEGSLVGFVPPLLAEGLLALEARCQDEILLTIEHVSTGPDVSPNMDVLCRFESCVPEDGYSLFSGDEWQPLASQSELALSPPEGREEGSRAIYPWEGRDEMEIDREFAVSRYGDKIELGPCVVGRDIDLLAIRGFATLDSLALVSSPDVFDDEVNPSGTQRELKLGHANSSFRYATEDHDPDGTDVRAFPEVILNVRDMLCVDVSLWSNGESLIFDSHSADEDIPSEPVRITVDLDAIEFPKSTIDPEISRVDGNHRLYGPDQLLEGMSAGKNVSDVAMPSVPFMIFLNLSIDEELKLFNDLNGKHEGMEPSLIVTQTVRLGPEAARNDPRKLPAWIAFELTRHGRTFENIVFVGGSRRGAKEAGKSLRLTISALRGAAGLMIRGSHTLKNTMKGQPDSILTVVDNYWRAVSEVFPEAWSNKRDFILLQSIGLNGFAEFGATVIDRAEGNISVEDFKAVLEGIRPEITLDRSDSIYDGRAGAGGASFVADMLREKSTAETIVRSKILKATGAEPALDEVVSGLEGDVVTDGKETDG